MEEQVDRLVTKLQGKLKSTPPSERYLVAISGIPGSGKTTLASTVVKRLNATLSKPAAAFVPMDGYHLPRSVLRAMPDWENALVRRGAAFTFDGEAFLSLVQRIRNTPPLPASPTLYAPSFDHAIKDPVENDIPIDNTARIVVFEGNYLSLDKGTWKDAAALMDELWFVQVEREVARQRLVERHVRTGVAPDEGQAGKRADENDLVNGDEIVKDRVRVVQEVIVSKEDYKWAPEKT